MDMQHLLRSEGFDHGGLLPLGTEYMLTDDHHLVSAALGLQTAASSLQHSVTNPAAGPTSTVVGSSGGLQFDLIWDNSVRTSANWSAVESSVVAAARIYTNAFSNHAVLNIQVGFGEIGGAQLDADALGESQSNGYIVNYAMVTNALATADAGLVHAGQMTAASVQGLQGLRGESFFLSSGEAKALNLVNPTAPGVDGYIGLTNSGALYFPAANGFIRSNQYDAVGVAAHELSEVMGRIGLEGRSLGSYADVYTPLDIFRYSAPHMPQTASAAGYFSTNSGVPTSSSSTTQPMAATRRTGRAPWPTGPTPSTPSIRPG